MREFKVTEEQIREAYESACDEWKAKLRNWFPKAFDVKKGTWYRCVKYNNLVYNNGENKEDLSWGFTYNSIRSKWADYMQFNTENQEWVEVTQKEVEEALIHEALNRGFTYKSNFTALRDTTPDIDGEKAGYWTKEGAIAGSGFDYNIDSDTLYVVGYGRFVIYEKGKWAKILPTVLQKAVDELGIDKIKELID